MPTPSVRDKAKANLRTIVANESKRLGAVDDRPPFLRNNDDIQEALAARRGDNLGQRTKDLKSMAREENAAMAQAARNKNASATIPKRRRR